jgi:hypothetical protein
MLLTIKKTKHSSFREKGDSLMTITKIKDVKKMPFVKFHAKPYLFA